MTGDREVLVMLHRVVKAWTCGLPGEHGEPPPPAADVVRWVENITHAALAQPEGS